MAVHPPFVLRRAVRLVGLSWGEEVVIDICVGTLLGPPSSPQGFDPDEALTDLRNFVLT